MNFKNIINEASNMINLSDVRRWSKSQLKKLDTETEFTDDFGNTSFNTGATGITNGYAEWRGGIKRLIVKNDTGEIELYPEDIRQMVKLLRTMGTY